MAGNARVAGLQKDLKLTDAQYQICLTVLFVSVKRVDFYRHLIESLLAHISRQNYRQASSCARSAPAF